MNFNPEKSRDFSSVIRDHEIEKPAGINTLYVNVSIGLGINLIKFLKAKSFCVNLVLFHATINFDEKFKPIFVSFVVIPAYSWDFNVDFHVRF